MAKPKLALIPASQGSKVFSVLPSSGVGDFDFSRSGSATRINSQGLIEEVANGQSRLNYPLIDGVVSGCPSLLLEPARTNEFPYSNDLTNGYWINSNALITLNSVISPDGSLNGVTLESLGTDGSVIKFNYWSTTQKTVSVFAKKGNHNIFQILQASNGYVVEFDLENGIILSQSSVFDNTSIEDYGNGWYRCSVTYTKPSTTATFQIKVLGLGNSVNFFGVQGEPGSYPTSYIPTNGSAVTRAAETANGSGDATTFNDSEGVLMAEISALRNLEETRAISLSDGSTDNNLFINTASVNSFIVQMTIGGSIQFTTTIDGVDQTNFNKIAVKYKANDYAVFLNGILKFANNSGGSFPINTLDRLNFDFSQGSFDFYGNTKQIQYYNSALTDSELEQLTSWTSFTEMAQAQLYSVE